MSPIVWLSFALAACHLALGLAYLSDEGDFDRTMAYGNFFGACMYIAWICGLI